MSVTNTQLRDLINDKILVALFELNTQVAVMNGRVASVEKEIVSVRGRIDERERTAIGQGISITRLQERNEATRRTTRATAERVFDLTAKVAGIAAVVGILVMLLRS